MAQSICGRGTTTTSTSDIQQSLKRSRNFRSTVIDGEVVAFDQEGRPSFNALQNYGSAPGPVVYYVFDVMVLRGENGPTDAHTDADFIREFGSDLVLGDDLLEVFAGGMRASGAAERSMDPSEYIRGVLPKKYPR